MTGEPSQPAKGEKLRAQVLRNTLSNTIGKIVTLGVWFFLTPFLLHQLGASDYGLWILITSIVAYGSLLDFGVANAITKYVAQYHAEGQIEQAHSLVATALWLYMGLGLVAIALGAVLAPILPTLLQLPPEQHATASWLTLLSALALGVSLPSATTISVLRGGYHRDDVVHRRDDRRVADGRRAGGHGRGECAGHFGHAASGRVAH